MSPRPNARLRRFRLPSVEEEEVAAAAQQQEQPQQQQHSPLWHRLLGVRPLPQVSAPQAPPTGIKGGQGQGQGPAERWEQVPLSIQLMNEICDAMSIGSDFAFWTGLAIIIIVLVGLMIWYSG
ncbi:hypothetical protein EKO04_008431 [Ascochyta lentis]|uniref:Uncharacterized protein n=1 Tax=Ascochyta lentis TaxID=205686 RepID=A0A8H7IZY9_9PLEO|nr:hypothetical protein EKO04_008431 [Ascochyta lentis]